MYSHHGQAFPVVVTCLAGGCSSTLTAWRLAYIHSILVESRRKLDSSQSNNHKGISVAELRAIRLQGLVAI